MFMTVAHFFNVLMFLDITLAILCCVLLIRLPTKYAIKYITIPLLLFVTYVSVIYSEDLFGRPYESIPIGKFEIKDYRIVDNNGVKKVELWIIQNKKSRLHIIDYVDSEEQQLSKARTKIKKGIKQEGEFTKSDKKHKNTSSSNVLAIGDIPLEEILPPKGE